MLMRENHTFSAKEKDSETGLSYFGSRYYSSDLSIWLSVDPMSDKYPSLSPYVYCANNPIKLVVAQEVAMSFPSRRVIRALEKVIWINGKPDNIRCDNGPEFICKDFREWCEGNDIKILFTQPGCPTQNGYIERFNGSYRRAVLDAYIFRTIEEVRQRTEVWNEYYNYERPHESLGNKTPMEFSKRRNDQDTSVVVRSCKDSPCPTPRQGYTSVLRTALTRRLARPFRGITGQQCQKNIEKIILNDIF